MARMRANTKTSDRKAMRSPGRPPAAVREQLVQFWKAIAAGRSAICHLPSEKRSRFFTHNCQSALEFDPLSASNIDPRIARVVTEGGRSPTGCAWHGHWIGGESEPPRVCRYAGGPNS
ncbi:MAG: hypothetical protein FD148_2528 [Methylocystaceae bacterium]|nr:MAG: hypothetical protein FD148_2528 [Methylocystaceae bacterium]